MNVKVLAAGGTIAMSGAGGAKVALDASDLVASVVGLAGEGDFAIGLVETNLLDIENRMIFFLAVACFTGLVRELRAETPSAVTRAGQAYAGTAIAYSRPL